MPHLTFQLEHARVVGRRRGFTFVELCLGLVVTSMVMGAMSAFLIAVAQNWKNTEARQDIATQGRHLSVRMTRMIQDAKAVGAVSTGGLSGTPATPAAVILWVHDDNLDGAVQGAECAMIQHDPANNRLMTYPYGQGDKDIVLPWSLFTSQSILGTFPSGRDSFPLARHVERARFAILAQDHASMTPTLEFTFKMVSGAPDASGQLRSMIEYGTTAVRAPAKRPD